MKHTTEQGMGKQVFLLPGESPLHHGLMTHLVRNEFESYSINEVFRLLTYVTGKKRAVLCIDPAHALTLSQWAAYINTIQQQVEDRYCNIVLLAAKKTVASLVSDFGVHAESLHHIDTEADQADIVYRLIDVLEELGSKGQRNYVRFGAAGQANASFRFVHQGTEYAGVVNDISSAGMACAFDKETVFDIDDYISEIRLYLGTKEFVLSGKVFQKRWLDEVNRLFIVMFDRRMTKETRRVLQDFIHSSLQHEMEIRLDGLPSFNLKE